jgi:hypothetical protein
MIKRNPRTDPIPGDELVIFHGGRIRWWRKVLSKDIDVRTSKCTGVRYITNSGKTHWMPLDRWIEQMRNAVRP